VAGWIFLELAIRQGGIFTRRSEENETKNPWFLELTALLIELKKTYSYFNSFLAAYKMNLNIVSLISLVD
jgi:hypothetical protein